MSPADIRVDGDGVHLPSPLVGGCEVRFDDQQVWAFDPEEHPVHGGDRFVPWHREVRRRLAGRARVSLHQPGRVLYDEEVRFGPGDDPPAFVDKAGHRIMIDKWGLVQKPFSGRGPEALRELVDVTRRVLDVLERDCGVQAWIAFGSLLGAVRSGGAIGHDSDIDLAYLSACTTPAEMAREMFGISRALRRAGFGVLNKSGSFVTVLFAGADGARSSIDVYTCFYVGDVLYETATVGAAIPRSALLPLGEVEFEGHLLPAPARPDVLLEASYGPDWRVPDPTFSYSPDPALKDRFDPWFGNVMRHRRVWEGTWRRHRPRISRPSSFARWMEGQLPAHVPVIDVGCGNGGDALFLARRGHAVVGVDYARGATQRAAKRAARAGLDASFMRVNLYDLRDALTAGAVLARRHPGAVLSAHGLLDSLTREGRDNFWLFAKVALGGSGRAYVGLQTRREDGPPWFRVTHEELASGAAAAGGSLVAAEPATRRRTPQRALVEWDGGGHD